MSPDLKDPDGRNPIVIRELAGAGEFRSGATLLAEVWGTDGGRTPVSSDLMRALSHTGHYGAGAFVQGQLVGVSVGFLAWDTTSVTREPRLHSHITGISRHLQSAGLGQEMKLHQRRWCLDRGIGTVTWTFDPLIRRNAYFNLTKLGAEVHGFQIDFYGAMADGFNGGDETDRCETIWDLNSPRVVGIVESAATPDIDAVVAAWREGGASVILDTTEEGDPQTFDLSGDRRLCRVPADIFEIRRRAPDLARRWRVALRDTLGASIADGFVATAVSPSGWYLLQRRLGGETDRKDLADQPISEPSPCSPQPTIERRDLRQ